MECPKRIMNILITSKKVIHKVWAENLKNYTVDEKSDTNGVYISLVQHQ